MKKLVILCSVILFVLLPAALVVGCQQPAPAPSPTPTPAPAPPPPPPPPPPPAVETLTYTNSEYSFSCDYPKDWDFEEGLIGTIVLFAGPMVKGGEFMVNMNIVLEELPEFPKITLEDYLKLGEMQLKKVMENYQKVNEHSATICGLPAIVFTYTADFEGDKLMLTQALFLKENVAYVITYAAPPEFHDEYVKSFELVISSFELK